MAYETVVLGALRRGYRNVPLRDAKHGTRIELCALFVHLDVGDEPNTAATAAELQHQLDEQQAQLEEQRAEIATLRERLAGGAAAAAPEFEFETLFVEAKIKTA